MAAIFIQNGEAIDYVPETAKAAGDVVAFGSAGIGVVKEPIAAGELGALALTGVYEFGKATGGAIAFGAKVYYNTTSGKVQTAATGGVAAGYAVAYGATGDAGIRVRIG